MRHLRRAVLFLLVTAASLEAEPQKLSTEHRRWLEEEVVYIITDREKEFFLSLETLEESESFIAAFWKRRDPDPSTPENEFKEEHYRRLDYANTELGKETVQPGWTTERGRTYIILGEPLNVERFVGNADVVTCELWFYQGDPRTRLPPFFNVLFYKRNDSEDYRLYSPVGDGPAKLVLGERSGLAGDTQRALQKLSNVSYDLAFASLSLDPAEPPDFASAQPSLSSDIVLAQIEDAAKYTARTDYIDNYLRYGGKVSADYSFNFIPSRADFALLAGPDAGPFLHYSLELDPENLTLATDEDRSRYYTTFDASIEVRTEEGRLIHGSEKEVFVELSPEDYERLGAFPFAYQDNLPLVPGDFQVTVILRNRTVKTYTVAEQEIHVAPLSEEQPGLAGLVLGYRIETTEAPGDGSDHLTFQVEPYRVYPASGATFFIGETAHVFAQLTGPLEGLHFRYRLLEGEQHVLREGTVPLDNALARVATGTLELEEMVGGRYTVRAELVDSAGRTVAWRATPLVVSPRTHILRPWVHRRSFDTRVPGLLALARGEQLLALGRYREAERELAKSVAAENPDLARARWRLAGIYLGWREPGRALELLLPMEERFAGQYEVVAGLGFAYHIAGDPGKAAQYLEKALSIRPPGTSILNALGDSYQKLGDAAKARRYLERSLEINPNQEAVEKQLAALKRSD